MEVVDRYTCLLDVGELNPHLHEVNSTRRIAEFGASDGGIQSDWLPVILLHCRC